MPLLQRVPRFVAEQLKPKLRPLPAKLEYNQAVEIKVRWNGAYILFTSVYQCPEGALSETFTDHFARIGYFSASQYNLWARRHNDEWLPLYDNLSLDEALSSINTDPWFEIV